MQTKGDANAAADPWTATLDGDTAYQVRAVVPGLGHVIQALRAPVVTQALLYGAPALLVGWLLLTIWRPARESRRTSMTGIRRGLILLGLTVAVVIGASVPASATFAEAVAVKTTISTTTVAAPDERGREAHLRPAGDDVGHLDAEHHRPGSPATASPSTSATGSSRPWSSAPRPPAGAPRSTRTT